MNKDTSSPLPVKCYFDELKDDTTLRQQAVDKILIERGTTKVNDLNPQTFSINDKKLTKFLEGYQESILNTKQKGPSYIIMDNFMEYFGLSKDDLLGTREDAKTLIK